MAQPEPGRTGPGAAPGKEPDTGASDSERIGSYYEDADRAMSDYLAELGWADEPGTDDPR